MSHRKFVYIYYLTRNRKSTNFLRLTLNINNLNPTSWNINKTKSLLVDVISQMYSKISQCSQISQSSQNSKCYQISQCFQISKCSQISQCFQILIKKNFHPKIFHSINYQSWSNFRVQLSPLCLQLPKNELHFRKTTKWQKS